MSHIWVVELESRPGMWIPTLFSSENVSYTRQSARERLKKFKELDSKWQADYGIKPCGYRIRKYIRAEKPPATKATFDVDRTF